MHSQCELSCERACVCEAGYLRNGTDGICIYPAECPNLKEEVEDEALLKQNRVAKESDQRDADQTFWRVSKLK